jgi:hypothetical protein
MQYMAFRGENNADFAAYLKLPEHTKYIFGLMLCACPEALQLKGSASHQSAAFRIHCKSWTLCLTLILLMWRIG